MTPRELGLLIATVAGLLVALVAWLRRAPHDPYRDDYDDEGDW